MPLPNSSFASRSRDVVKAAIHGLWIPAIHAGTTAMERAVYGDMGYRGYY